MLVTMMALSVLISDMPSYFDSSQISSVGITAFIDSCSDEMIRNGSDELQSHHYCGCMMDYIRYNNNSFPLIADTVTDKCVLYAKQQPTDVLFGFGAKPSLFQNRRLGSASVWSGFVMGMRYNKKTKYSTVICATDLFRFLFFKKGRAWFLEMVKQKRYDNITKKYLSDYKCIRAINMRLNIDSSKTTNPLPL